VDAHEQMNQKRASALQPDPQPRQCGSVAHRSQDVVSRSLGSDPLALSTVKSRSKLPGSPRR
jgi:hypothetical protein